MKKVIVLFCLVFVLVSCGEDKIIINDNLVDSNIEIKVEEKNKENKKVETEEQIEIIKNKNLIDETKYSEINKPAINLINQYIKNNLVKENIFGEIEILKTYNYFEAKGNMNMTKVVYAKDEKNYYYFCSEWPACEFNFEKYRISEGELKIINKFDYKIGDKEYLNGYIQGHKEMENDRINNQIIIKDYGNGLVLKQDTKGFMYDKLGSTILYLNGKELIGLANNLTTIFCDKNAKQPYDCFTENPSDEEIKKQVVSKFKILEDKNIDKKSNIKILYISQYDHHDTYFIDIRNEKIISNNLGWDIFVKSIIQGKSGTFIMSSGGRGCSGGLIFINNEGKLLNIFENNCDVDLNNIPSDYQEIIDFELMLNKQVKIFYKGQNLEKKEKIIDL